MDKDYQDSIVTSNFNYKLPPPDKNINNAHRMNQFLKYDKQKYENFDMYKGMIAIDFLIIQFLFTIFFHYLYQIKILKLKLECQISEKILKYQIKHF